MNLNKRCIVGLVCFTLLLGGCIPWGVAHATNDTVSTVPTTTTTTTVETTALTTTTTTTVETTAPTTTTTTTVETTAPTTTTTTTTATTVTVLPSAEEERKSDLRWPLLQTEGAVSFGYGYRWGELHRGMDIAVETGDPVVAAAAGKVIACETQGYNGGYGLAVVIDHGDGVSTVYAHLQDIAVSVGEHVLAGQTIARAGMSGDVTGPCLHFEVRVDGVGVDPLLWLDDGNVLQE